MPTSRQAYTNIKNQFSSPTQATPKSMTQTNYCMLPKCISSNLLPTCRRYDHPHLVQGLQCQQDGETPCPIHETRCPWKVGTRFAECEATCQKAPRTPAALYCCLTTRQATYINKHAILTVQDFKILNDTIHPHVTNEHPLFCLSLTRAHQITTSNANSSKAQHLLFAGQQQFVSA